MHDDGAVGGSLGRRRLALGWALAVLGNVLLTVALQPVHHADAPAFEAMLYLSLAVATALVGGLVPALAASLLGVLALNYWFIEPVHTLDVATGANVLMLVTFALVSAAVSSVVDAAARRRAQATAARAEADTLGDLNRTLLAGTYDVTGLLDVVRDTFGARAAELVSGDAPAAPGDTVSDASQHSSLVLRGVSLEPAQRRILDAFATHVGVLREREELARQTAAARELEAGNRARTALLAAVSHDLRTPLAGLRAASSTLRRHDADLAPADRAELLEAVETSAVRLSRMVADLLDMSRLQTGAVEPVLVAVPAGDIVHAVLEGLDGLTDPDRVTVVEPLPSVVADAALLARVLANLVGNAVRHTEGTVEVRGSAADARARICVVDHGPGVPPKQWDAMFEPFRRLGETAGDRAGDAAGAGVGLGLAVARGLVEVQGGALHAEPTQGGGLTMVVSLAAP
jgi:two-component system sensor histidine kinase KdpD